MSETRVLIIGTTADYVEFLDDLYAGRLLYVTEPSERANWKGPNPSAINEVLIPLHNNEAGVVAAIKKHLQEHNLTVTGVTCFDCESLALSSTVAKEFNLLYSDSEPILRSRSKYTSKFIWESHGVGCPEAKIIHSEGEAVNFLKEIKASAVMKPLTGSGSEYIFLCHDEDSARQAYRFIIEKLSAHSNFRLYGSSPHNMIAMERYIGGEEYSADFILENNELRIVRIAKKMARPNSTFGTTLGYVLPGQLPSGITEEYFAQELKKAAQALGFKRIMGMVDLKIENGKMYFIELTPRCGGDCLPHLIKATSGFDILKAHFDFAEGKPVTVPSKDQWKKYLGVQLIASQRGQIKKIDDSVILADPRVVKCELFCGAGEKIELPPLDYESRRLGYVIVNPHPSMSVEAQCTEIADKLVLEMETAVESAGVY